MQRDNRSSSLIARHVTGVLALPLLFAYVYYLPPLPYFLLLLGLIAAIAMREFYVMYRVPSNLHIPGILIGVTLFYLFCRYPGYFFEGVFISLLILLTLRLFLAASPSGCISEIGPIVTGLFYISFFLSFQWRLRMEDSGLGYIFFLYISIWLADAMAYYIGTYMGRHKLYPAVSPKKTVEGAAGSLIGGVLGAMISRTIFNLSSLSAQDAAVIGIVLGVTALIGDLIESMFKRDAGVKDSGSLIPGHGGILDKIDGFLVAGPVLYLIVRYF